MENFDDIKISDSDILTQAIGNLYDTNPKNYELGKFIQHLIPDLSIIDAVALVVEWQKDPSRVAKPIKDAYLVEKLANGEKLIAFRNAKLAEAKKFLQMREFMELTRRKEEEESRIRLAEYMDKSKESTAMMRKQMVELLDKISKCPSAYSYVPTDDDQQLVKIINDFCGSSLAIVSQRSFILRRYCWNEPSEATRVKNQLSHMDALSFIRMMWSRKYLKRHIPTKKF